MRHLPEGNRKKTINEVFGAKKKGLGALAIRQKKDRHRVDNNGSIILTTALLTTSTGGPSQPHASLQH